MNKRTSSAIVAVLLVSGAYWLLAASHVRTTQLSCHQPANDNYNGSYCVYYLERPLMASVFDGSDRIVIGRTAQRGLFFPVDNVATSDIDVSWQANDTVVIQAGSATISATPDQYFDSR